MSTWGEGEKQITSHNRSAAGAHVAVLILLPAPARAGVVPPDALAAVADRFRLAVALAGRIRLLHRLFERVVSPAHRVVAGTGLAESAPHKIFVQLFDF